MMEKRAASSWCVWVIWADREERVTAVAPAVVEAALVVVVLEGILETGSG